MAYKDDYYEGVDTIFDGMHKDNPYDLESDVNAIHQQEADGQIQPVGWVENARAADGVANVIINADGIKILGPSGETVMEAGQVRIVNNSTGDVVINASGITITNGAITVTNPSATVVIDGTSNMFKIQATGTLTLPSGGGVLNTSVTLSSLGTFTEVPALLGSNVFGGNTFRAIGLGIETGSIAPGTQFLDTFSVMFGQIVSSELVIRLSRIEDYASTSTRYYVLKEAGI